MASLRRVPRRVIAHIGMPKTATTYIQNALFRNRDLLAAHGVYLPAAGANDLQSHSVSHHQLAWEINSPTRVTAAMGGWSAVAAELQSVPRDHVALISSEGLSQSVTERGRGAQLLGRLRSLGTEVTIVMVVREQLSAINSKYNQSVKMLQPRPPYDEYVTGAVDRMDLDVAFRDWYDLDDIEFIALPFSSLVERDPLVALLDAVHVNVDVDAIEVGPGEINTSLGPIGVEVFRVLSGLLHASYPDFRWQSVAGRRLHRRAAARARELGWCDERFWGWSPDSAAAAAERLAASNERFAQAMWGTPWPMPLPVGQPQAVARLHELDAPTLREAWAFLAAMPDVLGRLREPVVS